MTPDELGKLLSLISHEVRGPLGVMRGYLRLMEQHNAPLDDVQRRAVTASLKASVQAADILTEVSSLASYLRQEVSPASTPVGVLALLHSAAQPPTPGLDPRGNVDAATPPNLTVSGDEALLRTALIGLITAVTRAQFARGVVTLSARDDDRRGRPGVRIVIGRDHAEAPGTSVPLDTSRGGIGVGLPIAQWVVDAHHGMVAEHFDDDHLSAITVWLPVTPDAASAP